LIVEEDLIAGMKLQKHIFLFVLILLIGSLFNELYSQNAKVKPTRQSSLEAYSRGNFEQAYNEFSELLLTYSKDPLYMYYSGVCLVKLNRDPEKAANLLGQALQGSLAVKTLPTDALFYHGKAQQMSGKYQEAIASYNSYTDQAGKKTAREQGVPEAIQQCKERKGALADTRSNTSEVVDDEKVIVAQTKVKPVIKEVQEKPSEQLRTEPTSIPSGYEDILDEALKYQFQADSVTALVNLLKKKLASIPAAEASVFRSRINDEELVATEFQKSADQKYSEAQLAMNPLAEKTQQKDGSQKPENEALKDSAQEAANEIINLPQDLTETIKKIAPAAYNPVETFSLFEVLDKPVTDPKEKIPIDDEVPEGLIYRIQVAVFRNPVAPVYFRGISPIYGFKITGNDRTNYYAGMFRRAADARKALASVKAKGFKDAFVVPFLGKKTVSGDRAAILEKQWGSVPFTDASMLITEVPVDTLPPTLSFRVEIIRSEEPLEEDRVTEFRKVAGNRGFTIQLVDDGSIVYLIGKFITFESAEEYADLLVRNGYREAKVVAWLGNKEIPVETARQLFDFLE
jgi:hypothetical protein